MGKVYTGKGPGSVDPNVSAQERDEIIRKYEEGSKLKQANLSEVPTEGASAPVEPVVSPTQGAGGFAGKILNTVLGRTLGAGQGRVAQTQPGPTEIAGPSIQSAGVPESEIQRTQYDAEGRELSRAEKIALRTQENEAAQQAVKRPGSVDFTSREELSRGFVQNGIIQESDQGKVQSVAKDVVDGLTKLDDVTVPNTPSLNHTVNPVPTGNSGINIVKQTLGTDSNADAVGAIVNGFASVGLELAGQQTQKGEEVTSVGSQTDPDDIFAELEKPVGEDSVPGQVVVKGMKPDVFKARLGQAIKKYQENLAVSQGVDPTTARGANTDVLGGIGDFLGQSQGLFKVSKNAKGEPIIVPTDDRGVPFIQSMKKAQAATVRGTKGGQSLSPANLDKGWYNSTLKGVRKSELTRRKPDGNKRGTPKDIVDYQVSHGSVGHASTPGQIGAAVLLNIMANNGDANAQDILRVGQKRLNKMINKGTNVRKANHEISNEHEKNIKSIKDWSAIKNGNQAQYNYLKIDPTVLRGYPENLAIEIQNNLMNRFLDNSNVPQYLKVDKNMIFSLLNSPKLAEESFKYFQRQVGKGGKINDRHMAILSNLVLAHKNIKGSAADTMTWQARVNEINPAWVQEHANTGRLIQSAIDKLGVINADGTINTEVVDSLLPTINKDGTINRNDDGSPILDKENQLNLTPEERAAIATWLDPSLTDKKNAGYRLTSFLELNNLVNAIGESADGGHWNPKITGDIDMNSAGRTFIANDIGDLDVLERTGVVWNAYGDTDGGDTVPFGNPRKYFRIVAQDILKSPRDVQRQFQNAPSDISKEDLGANLAAILEQEGDANPDFDSDFAKGILLTDDYGMNSAMHTGDAINLLNSSPAIQQFMNEQYDGDQTAFVKDMTNLIKDTLLKPKNSWQKSLPKNMTKMLGMFNRFPEPTMMFGETASIGSDTMREVRDAPKEAITLPDGQVISVTPKERVKNILAKGPSKEVVGPDGSKSDYVPEEGTLVVNQVGPILGQYRESATLINADKLVNPDKSKTPQYWSSVHDNINLDGKGFAKWFFALNTKGGAADKVLDFDLMPAFINDFNKQKGEVVEELRAAHKRGEKVNIGRNGDHTLIMVEGDKSYKAVHGDPSNGTPPLPAGDYRLDYHKKLLKIFESMGYRGPDKRANDQNFLLDPADVARGFVQLLGPDGYNISAQTGKFAANGTATASRNRAQELRKKQDMLYFVT